MQQLRYPLLYFQLSENQFLGMLVGTSYRLLAPDLRTLKTRFSTHLKKRYKRDNEYPYLELRSAKLKHFRVSARPVYQKGGQQFPAADTLSLPVVAVYGPTEGGFFECHLPLLQEQFYYQDKTQLKSLVRYFAQNALNQQSVEQLHRYLLQPKASLDEVTLRVNIQRNEAFGADWFEDDSYPTLQRLAMPYPSATKREKSRFPEVAWELEDQVHTVVDKLLQSRANVLLLGPSGVGKTAVLKQAIRKVLQQVGKSGMPFWRIMAQRITASARYLGEWQETAEELIEELHLQDGVLWVSDFVQLLRVGGQSASESVAAFFSPFLQSGELQLVGELRPEELESMRRLLPGFVEHFQIVEIPELPEPQIQRVLQQFTEYCSRHLKVQISQAAQELSYRLLLRYYPYEHFPGKAIRFLSELISQSLDKEQSKIDKLEVTDYFVQKTGMPSVFLRDDQRLNDQELQQYFEARIIGQPQAVATLCELVKIFKAGLNNPHKPIRTFMFVGPTGVGKTATAKALAAYFFGKGQQKSPLVRIDMSEIQHAGHLVRLIGAGNEVGKLVKDIRSRPFSVLLLDEIEKADASVFDTLLSVLDEGRLVDTFGRVTNFRNTIIIMTSNVGASQQQAIGFGGGANPSYTSAISKYFRPEFVNRIDTIVTFQALDQEAIRRITDKELAALQQREGIAKMNIDLSFTERLRQAIGSIGFDERYGARPLQRAVEQQIVAPLSKWLLEHPSRNKRLELDYIDQKLSIQSL